MGALHVIINVKNRNHVILVFLHLNGCLPGILAQQTKQTKALFCHQYVHLRICLIISCTFLTQRFNKKIYIFFFKSLFWKFPVYNYTVGFKMNLSERTQITGVLVSYRLLSSQSHQDVCVLHVCCRPVGSFRVSSLTFSFFINNWSAFFHSELQDWNTIQGTAEAVSSQCCCILNTLSDIRLEIKLLFDVKHHVVYL